MAADYRHIGGFENRLGRHYSRFSLHPGPLPINHLLCENRGTQGRIGEVRLERNLRLDTGNGLDQAGVIVFDIADARSPASRSSHRKDRGPAAPLVAARRPAVRQATAHGSAQEMCEQERPARLRRSEQEKDESAAVTRVRCVLDQAERGGAVGANAAQFAVKIGLPRRERRYPLGDLPIFMRPVEPGAGQQSDRATVEARMHPVAVELELVQPFRSVRRLVDQFGELRFDPGANRDREFADSSLEGAGFEPSVPRRMEKTRGAKSDLQEEKRRRRLIRRNKAPARCERLAPDRPSRKLPPPPRSTRF